MATTVMTVLASIGGVVLLLFVMQLIARATAASVRRKLASRFPADVIVLQDDLVNYFGRSSKGTFQTRTSGGLVLTREAIHFVALVGDDFIIERKDITGVETPRSFLGKSVGRKLLKIDCAGDSVGFVVNDLEAWKSQLAVPA